MTPVVPLNHRYLYQNQLTTLDAGLFDKNTALKLLYVDNKGVMA